jgi:hypothetical protein
MIDIWGHGSTGSLINMVYSICYGMGYNNITLTKSRFEMNSYSTQVAQLQFEYIYELDKICIDEQDMDQGGLRMIFNN